MSSQKFALALIIDICLLLAFAIPHSLLAHDSIKKMHGIPENWERAVFCLQSTLLIHSQMHFWRNFGGNWTLWDVSDNVLACRALIGVFLFGVLFLFSATFALDHFHLAGLSQGFGIDINAALGLSPTVRSGVSMRAHYSFVAHPIMTGTMIAIWAQPRMTLPRLLFSVFQTSYIVIAVKMLEEPKLIKTLGKPYADYLETVPSFCPFTRWHTRSAVKGD
eukprot:gene27571-36370_t